MCNCEDVQRGVQEIYEDYRQSMSYLASVLLDRNDYGVYNQLEYDAFQLDRDMSKSESIEMTKSELQRAVHRTLYPS